MTDDDDDDDEDDDDDKHQNNSSIDKRYTLLHTYANVYTPILNLTAFHPNVVRRQHI